MTRWLLCCLCTVIFSVCCPAGDNLPDWAAPLARIDCSGHDTTKVDAVCLEDRMEVAVQPSGEMVQLVRQAFRILTADGTSWGTVVLPYGQRTKIKDIRGWVQYPNGQVKMIKDKDTIDTQYLDGNFYSDVRKKIIYLPEVVKGAFLCYQYEMDQTKDFPVEVWNFQSTIPTHRSELVLSLPPGAELVWKAYNLKNMQPAVTGNRYVFVRDDVPALPVENLAPPLVDLAERIALRIDLPAATQDVVTDCRSWEDIAKWYYRMTKDRWQTAESVRKVADQLCQGATDPNEKIRRLCGWVQAQIRYLAIIIGVGGYVPHPSSEVCQSKYGDCKDKSFLLMNLLRSQGITAWPVLCQSRLSGDIDPEFPWAGSFNHCIVAIQQPDGTLHFFDPTSDNVGYPYLPSSLDRSLGLLVKEDGGSLVQIVAAQKPRLEMHVKASLSTSGMLLASVREVYSPSALPGVRGGYREKNEADRRQEWSDWLNRRIPGVKLSSLTWSNLFQPDQDLIIDYVLEARGVAKPMGDMWMLNPFFILDMVKPSLTKKERELPIWLHNYAVTSHQVVELTFPAGFRIEEGVEPVSLACDFGKFTIVVDEAGNKLTITKEFDLQDQLLPVGRFDEVKKFLEVVNNAEKVEILFVTK
jgi:transglutaminase-like putative cysteine protease